MTKTQKILMFGPGSGHNIKKWLDYFDNKNTYQTTFLSNTEPKFKTKTIKIFEKKNILNFFKLVPEIRRTKYDLLIIHGGFNWRVLLIITYLFRYKKSIFIPWGIKITELASNKTTSGYFYRKCFEKFDIITSTYSIEKSIKEKLPQFSQKLEMFLWGLDINIVNESSPPTNFTTNFLSSLDDDEIFIFYPRSIVPISRFDLLIESVFQLKNSLPPKVKIVIWHGNQTDLAYKKELEKKIETYNLNDIIKLIEHPYLPDSDIYAIWKRADFSVNIIESDGLSSQVMEAFIFEKPILLSRISTYIPLDDKYGLELDFTNNSIDDIKSKLEILFKTYKGYDKEILFKRRLFALKHFNFEENMHDLLKKIFNDASTL